MSDSEMFEAPESEELSKIIPGFTVGPLLAKGADSAVYSAIQTSLDRQVALRIFSPAASSDPERVRGVEATTRAMARLKHRNLIGLFDSGTREGMMYTVMEFVAGKPLARSLAGGPVHHAQVRSIITGVCEGLAHAHQNKIAHGNLTAHAILLNPDAEPKIGGFQGGDFEKTHVADIVAVGRLLYLMLTGVEDNPRSVEPSVIVGSPPELDEIWLRCIQRDLKDSFTSMQEMVEVLAKPRKKTAHASPTPAPSRGGLTPGTSTLPAATTRVSTPSHWPLIRNLLLIVVLIVAIIKVWGMTQRKEREILQKQIEQRQRAAQEQEKRYQEALRKRNSKHPTQSVKSSHQSGNTKPGVPKEIREAPLAEIREALASGNRDTMPIGSVRRADSAYLLVRNLLSWPEACWFAEQHGAHLAIPDASADLWLQSIANGEPIWLGAGRSGRSGRDAWQLVDGNPWQPSKEPAGLGRYLAADKFGFLRSAGDQVRLAFILQWRMDGSNPGQLERLLSAAANSLAKGNPAYPPGTDLLGDRAYLVVTRDVNWDEAKSMAGLGGGHLAAASDAAEVLYLQDMVRNFTAGKLYWMGARRSKTSWSWETGEAWRDIRITGAYNKSGAALAASSDQGWQALKASDKAAGFVIEWASPTGGGPSEGSPKTTTPLPPVPEDPQAKVGDGTSDSIGILDAQAKRLIKTESDKWNRDLDANAAKFRSDLDIIYRKMNRTSQREWEGDFDELKQQIHGNRVPANLASQDIEINEEMSKVCLYAANKQMAIDAEFTGSANKVREAYQKKLREMIAKAQDKGGEQAESDLQQKLDVSGGLDAWLTELGFTPLTKTSDLPKKPLD